MSAAEAIQHPVRQFGGALSLALVLHERKKTKAYLPFLPGSSLAVFLGAVAPCRNIATSVSCRRRRRKRRSRTARKAAGHARTDGRRPERAQSRRDPIPHRDDHGRRTSD